jgi:hypothetical protein
VWGGFLDRVARALQTAFPAGDAPAIHLPGLFSYGDPGGGSGRAATWPETLLWVEGLAREVAALAGSEEERAAGIAGPSDVFRGLDYHVYHSHGTEGHPAVPRSIVSTIWEVRCLREVLTLWGFAEPEISIFEDGMRATQARFSSTTPSSCFPDFLPSAYDRTDEASYELYQANEVYRRLAGALAAGASVQGWHTLLAAWASAPRDGAVNLATCWNLLPRDYQSYHSFGLREDGPEVSPRTEPC